jgi:hypothetical protein
MRKQTTQRQHHSLWQQLHCSALFLTASSVAAPAAALASAAATAVAASAAVACAFSAMHAAADVTSQNMTQATGRQDHHHHHHHHVTQSSHSINTSGRQDERTSAAPTPQQIAVVQNLACEDTTPCLEKAGDAANALHVQRSERQQQFAFSTPVEAGAATPVAAHGQVPTGSRCPAPCSRAHTPAPSVLQAYLASYCIAAPQLLAGTHPAWQGRGFNVRPRV